MQRRSNSKIGSRAGERAGSLIMLALLLFLGVAAVSITAHELVCPDADQLGHHCVVTEFAAGQIETPLVAVACLAVLLGVLTVLSWNNEAHPASPLFQLSPSRAPPASLA
jgi:hypothetical protein